MPSIGRNSESKLIKFLFSISLQMWNNCTNCLVVLPSPFKSNNFTDIRFFNTFCNEIPFCFSALGLQKEIEIALISVGAFLALVCVCVCPFVCLCLCMSLCPERVPSCCVRCHGALSRVLHHLSELFRCCLGDRKKIHQGTNQTQTELQEKGQKEKCNYSCKYPRPVCSGSSVYSPGTNEGFHV